MAASRLRPGEVAVTRRHSGNISLNSLMMSLCHRQLLLDAGCDPEAAESERGMGIGANLYS